MSTGWARKSSCTCVTSARRGACTVGEVRRGHCCSCGELKSSLYPTAPPPAHRAPSRLVVPEFDILCHKGSGRGLYQPGVRTAPVLRREKSGAVHNTGSVWQPRGGWGRFLAETARLTSSLLGVDAGQSQVLPKHFKQVVQVQFHATAAREDGAVRGAPWAQRPGALLSHCGKGRPCLHMAGHRHQGMWPLEPVSTKLQLVAA